MKGKELERLTAFLRQMNLDYEEGIEYSICLLNEDYQIIGTGSVEQNVLKCIAIAPEARGLGLSGTIISSLVQYEFEQARPHLLMYTKPENQDMFGDLGFHTVLMTKDVLFMENKARGFETFLNQLKRETPEEALEDGNTVGAVVANCNPFTLGHRYLIEEALKQCDYLHLFILSDKRGMFDAEERFAMVQAGIRGLDRVILHRASDFIISAATFPTYFMKEKDYAGKANCRLDLELFGKRIAPALGITKRFVGTEPACPVTGSYNQEMKVLLPEYGIKVVEMPRIGVADQAVSASTVRELLVKGEFERVRSLVPQTTWEYLIRIFGDKKSRKR